MGHHAADHLGRVRTGGPRHPAEGPERLHLQFPPGNSAWFTSLAAQTGTQWFDVSGDRWQVHMDTPETIEVAEYWDRMRTDGLIMRLNLPQQKLQTETYGQSRTVATMMAWHRSTTRRW